MSCQWRDKVALYVDNELDPAALQDFSAHLATCGECPAAVSEQMELKKALRVAGARFTAPPELHAAIYRSIHPARNVSPWWKWAMTPVCALLLVALGFLLYPRSRTSDPMIAGLVDQHITTLASEHPVDIVNSSQHVVKPWFAGKLPFTFNPPEVNGSPFTLVGGKLVYAGQNPGAELLYTAGLHKISVFVFQARNAGDGSAANHELSFNVERWTQGGLQYYLVTDANKDEAGKLVTMFQQANRQ
jgi:anti-sigma factor RsiW